MCLKRESAGEIPHHIVEDEATVGEFEVLEQAVQLAAVEGAPGAVQVVARLCLLTRVIVVQELEDNNTTFRQEEKQEEKGGGWRQSNF